MFIKQVIIQGFRSYRDQTVVDPFSPRHNVVVGRNGSGKSNFFYAIQFVLSDEFSHLRAEERQSLLHEGTGARIISAYVDIVFDNSDNRLPIEKDEVVLRRIIGAKKDQYFLDNKLVTRTDVMNLLETAGFSRSNPYYIVKQGKINMMATSPDSQRLKLLKEVAGTKVYDERKEESFKILEETKTKKTKIEDLLKYIEDRLNTLESEKEELKQFQKLDKMRRSLEYTIYNTELKETTQKIGDLNRHRDSSGDKSTQLQAQQSEVVEQMGRISKDLRDVKSRVNAQQDEREQLNSELQELMKEKARLELTIRDSEKDVDDEASAKKRAGNELTQLKNKIQEAEISLAEIEPKYKEQYDREERAKHELASAEQRRKELYAKQSRGSQFQTREQRDNWIKKEVKGLDRAASNKQDQMEKLKSSIRDGKERSEGLKTKIEDLSETMDKQKSIIDKNNTEYHNKKREKDNLANRRNALWREENTLQQALTMTKDELYKQEQGLRSITGKAVLHGIDSVKKVLDRLSRKGDQATVNGYHGLLIENFHCDKPYYTCVEVTAGSRLFFHIVDSDETSTRILSEMNKMKLPGEVSFMPLNRLESGTLNFPRSADKSAKPMIELLTFDSKYSKAYEHVFGKTLICKDIDTATQYSNSDDLDCITLQGDQVSRRGALTGGFYDNRKSRLELHNGKLELTRQIEEKEQECKDHKLTLEEVEKEVDKIITDMQKMETRNNKNKDVYEKMKRDLRSTKEEFDRISAQLPQQERSLSSLESSLQSILTSKDGLQSEMKQDLNSQLTGEDSQELEELTDKIKRLTQENKQALRERSQLEAVKNQIQNKLNNNLRKKEDRLKRELEDISVEDNSNKLETYRSDLESVDVRTVDMKAKVGELDKSLSKCNTEQKKLQSSLEACKGEEQDVLSQLAEDSKTLEKITTKISSLVKKKNEAIKKMSELGSLPSDAFDKYKDLSMKQLFKKLDTCNSDLKKYSHVNKKALDHFMSFSEQKEKFIARNSELNDAHSKIEELISALDHKKYEAIHVTFKQVSRYFTEIFSKLVPTGHGILVMKTDGPNPDTESEGSQAMNGAEGDAGQDEDRRLIKQFSGVGIKVSFTGNQAEMRDMQQLSGGQKSLVALALIFAIQKCDPAPFYLFDEIDQALDAQHRKGVADMIHESATDAQFITTTFRPELLEHADKFYGVRFRNKVSHIDNVTREEAYDFVEDDQQHA